MILKEAFTLWANDTSNLVQAARYREAAQRVLMRKWSDTELDRFTEPFTRELFDGCTEAQEYKSKAASLLVQILQWCAERGKCEPPTFTFDIASAKQPEQTARKPNRPEQEVRQEQVQEPQAKPSRGRTPRPVAQIDPATFEVVKVWPTMKEAERATGACNVDRSARLIRKSAGYYWSDASEADTFRERLDAKIRGVRPEVRKRKKKPAETVLAIVRHPEPEKKPTVPNTTPGGTDTGTIGRFTDEELFGELERRGWYGRLSHVQTVQIGKD